MEGSFNGVLETIKGKGYMLWKLRDAKVSNENVPHRFAPKWQLKVSRMDLIKAQLSLPKLANEKWVPKRAPNYTIERWGNLGKLAKGFYSAQSHQRSSKVLNSPCNLRKWLPQKELHLPSIW